MVSVIITTYKREFSMLQEAIDSVLAQTYPHMEIMVVDDNGGDGEYTRRIEEGLKAYPQYIAQGLVLICALALDVAQRNSVVRKAKQVVETKQTAETGTKS